MPRRNFEKSTGGPPCPASFNPGSDSSGLQSPAGSRENRLSDIPAVFSHSKDSSALQSPLFREGGAGFGAGRSFASFGSNRTALSFPKFFPGGGRTNRPAISKTRSGDRCPQNRGADCGPKRDGALETPTFHPGCERVEGFSDRERLYPAQRKRSFGREDLPERAASRLISKRIRSSLGLKEMKPDQKRLQSSPSG